MRRDEVQRRELWIEKHGNDLVAMHLEIGQPRKGIMR
jgi:hypothetical protein